MKWYLLIISVLILLNSCTTQSVSPTRKSRQSIDSTYQRKIVILQSEMDSICGIAGNTIFLSAVDSILAARQLEMNNLIK